MGNGGIQNGVVNVNFGSLAKGTGFYDSVNVTDGGKFAPGNSITNTTSGTLTLNSGSIYEFEINRAAGTPGGGGTTPPVGWDLLNLLVALNINSTSPSPATIQLVSRNAADTGPGTLPDFNPSQPFEWLAFHVNAGGSVNGFSAGQVHVRHDGVRQPDQPVRGRDVQPGAGRERRVRDISRRSPRRATGWRCWRPRPQPQPRCGPAGAGWTTSRSRSHRTRATV